MRDSVRAGGFPVGARVVQFAVLACVALAVAAGAAQVGSAVPAASSSFAVYLVRGEHVAPVRRLVPRTPAVARAALAGLLRGPTTAERRAGYASAIPSGTTLRGVSLVRGVVTVDLSGRFQAGGGSLSMLLRVAQVVYTATQFPSVERVAFRLNGRPVEAVGGEGVIVAPSVARAAFEAQAPPILVEEPLPGDRVGRPVVVRGTANVFEALLFVDVVTPTGTLVAHRSVLASAGTGTRGGFNVRIPLSVPLTRIVVVAYARSPKNGVRIDVVRVPVTLADGNSATRGASARVATASR